MALELSEDPSLQFENLAEKCGVNADEFLATMSAVQGDLEHLLRITQPRRTMHDVQNRIDDVFEKAEEPELRQAA